MQYAQRNRSARVLVLTLGLTVTASAGARAQTQVADTEPNSACAAAQDLTRTALPFVASGSLQTPPGTPDVDFYRFAATPGDLVRVDLDGSSVYPLTLDSPLLGVFDSACNVITTSDFYQPYAYVEVPADGILVAAATSGYDWDFSGDGWGPGTYRLEARRDPLARGLSGQVVDAETGRPISFAYVHLYRCTLSCEAAGNAPTDETGAFRFETGSFSLEGPLLAGTYYLELYRYPLYQTYETGQFSLAEGQDLDLGSLAMTPVPSVGSIRGRVIDRATGAPLSGLSEPRARVAIQVCQGPDDPWCGWRDEVPVEADGTFVYTAAPETAGLPPGWFRVWASADQYEWGQSAAFYLEDGQNHEAGDVAIASFPVRLYLGERCGEIPSTGGTCKTTVRIVNGLPTRLHADAWSVVQANRTDFGSTNVTTFQAGRTQQVNLAPQASYTMPLEFTVPGGVQDGTTICTQTVVSPHDNPFESFGSRYHFCLQKGVTGFAAVPDAQTREAVEKMLGRKGPQKP